MFEHHKEPLLSGAAFTLRLARHALLFAAVVGAALGMGILGYHSFEGLSWIDATVNASMILGGMGPVNELHTAAGKLFASAYALFSGLVFVVAMGVLFAPVVHRLVHQFHIQMASDDSTEES